VEGRGRDLEEDANEHHGKSAFDEELVLRVGGAACDVVDGRGAGGAEDEGDAVEEECRGEGAEEEVLDSGFGAFAGLLAIPSEDVGRDGGDFESDEDDEQFGGGCEETHADCAEDHQRVVLALVMAVFGECVEREKQRNDDDAADEDVEEDGEGAGLDGAGVAGAHWKRELPDAAEVGNAGA